MRYILPEKESWIELGGSGMFRPEVLEPLGVETPVLAFGLGIERLSNVKIRNNRYKNALQK